jgi:hypothetical protein
VSRVGVIVVLALSWQTYLFKFWFESAWDILIPQLLSALRISVSNILHPISAFPIRLSKILFAFRPVALCHELAQIPFVYCPLSCASSSTNPGKCPSSLINNLDIAGLGNIKLPYVLTSILVATLCSFSALSSKTP